MERKFIPIIGGLIFSILTFIIVIYLTTIARVPISYINEFVVIIPGPMITDIVVIYILPIIFFLIFYLISPYLIKIYIYFHKFIYWIIRRPSQYGIATLGKKVTAGRMLYRLFLVSLFSFSLTVLLVQMGFADLFRSWEHAITIEEASVIAPILVILYQAEAIFLGTFLICAITIILFFPIWLLEDSGLVSYRVFHEERMPIDIQGVHSLYNGILLGYAGFTAIIILARYIIVTIQYAIAHPNAFIVVITPILLIMLPFVVFGVIAIPLYLYEHLSPKNQSRLKEKLEKFNFPHIKIPSFEELKE